ncbi:hypothetical protein V6N13_008145 [Hibiscus sabdariffa]|uniref:VQ domain-containing protein n=1 Tax=Hibiscus sabdariffa TaxID=183260 RepID=A0ABR2EDW4_9ROSI
MSEILSASSSERMQLHQQSSDAIAFATNTSFVAPKGCISKPFRRRSRASKTTPITLLNADAKNFRSLVQQFTGCRHRSTTISFTNTTRGPVSIANANNDHRYNHSTTWGHVPILSQPFVEAKHEQQHYQYQQQLPNEEQQGEGEIAFDSITSTDDDDLFPQGFAMDDVFFLA